MLQFFPEVSLIFSEMSRNLKQLLEENFKEIGKKLWNSEKKSVKGW